MVTKKLTVFIVAMVITSCSGDYNVVTTTCIESDTHYILESTRQGDFLSSINFDVDAGIGFRGFDFIASATDVREGIDIIYNPNRAEFWVKTQRNDRLLKNVDKFCVEGLERFLLESKIEVPIHVQ